MAHTCMTKRANLNVPPSNAHNGDANVARRGGDCATLHEQTVAMRFAICNETFQGWEWDRTCTAVAELGYDGIEIAPFTLAEDVRNATSAERARWADTAKRAGLAVTGLHWLLVAPKGLSLTSRDDATRKETADYLVALVDFCADLGGKTMTLGSPAQRRIPEGDTRNDAIGPLIDAMRPALDRAAANGVTICLEPLPAPEADLILTLAEAVGVARALEHKALRTIFDVKSACSEGRPLPDLIDEFAPWIAHVHANDANRRGPGFGDTDYAPIFLELERAAYDGWVSVEVFDYTPDPITIARQSLAYMRRSLPAGAEMAR